MGNKVFKGPVIFPVICIVYKNSNERIEQKVTSINQNRSTTGGYNYAPVTEENGPLASYKIGETIKKIVRPMSCLYRSEENGFCIYDVEEDGRWFIIKGNFPYALILNSYYEITGTVCVDKKRNTRQINIQSCSSTMPVSKDGVITVLRTLHGLDLIAERLYNRIGPDILDKIMSSPEYIADKVPWIGSEQILRWQGELIGRGANDRELKKLYDFGLSQQQAATLVSKHGLGICSEVKANPYRLIGEIRGYSFTKCDKYAQDAGYSVRDKTRLREGLLYTMRAIEMKGHCTYPKEEFMKAAHTILDVSLNYRTAHQVLRNQKDGGVFKGRWGSNIYTISVSDLAGDLKEWESQWHSKRESYRYILDHIDEQLMEQALKSLQQEGKLIEEAVSEKMYITPGHFHEAEKAIVSGLKDIKLSERHYFKNLDAVIDEVLHELGVTLETKQMEAVKRICAAKGGAFILNGSAGCGKTFTLNIIMKVMDRLYKGVGGKFNPCILAPTGKAAKVAAASTELQAQTIHMGLGLVSSDDNDAFQISTRAIINNCIVVDEFSMVDENLCATLLTGIPKTAKVIFLGDTEQLPSIRAGRVLKDVIESGIIPVITLDVIKRQDAHSGILHNANQIIQGKHIATCAPNPSGTKGNAYVYEESSQQIIQNKIVEMAKQYGLQAFQNGSTQVLCPLKAGPAGVEALNHRLQEELNPLRKDVPEIVVGKLNLKDENGKEYEVKKVFRVGDCVINTQNDYQKEWYRKDPLYGYQPTKGTGVINGETGVVAKISSFKDKSSANHRAVYIKYDDHYICYDTDFDALSLAYALTIHKSQGSQWPNIICPLAQFSIILNRKLLYTMYTRAQESCTLFGSKSLISRTIANNKEDLRLTLLQERLKGRL